MSSRWEQQHDRDTGREPCPDRIVEDLGGAFGMGCIGGFLWHFVRGARNSPKGERFAGALYHGKNRAPILGGNFALWGGTFATCDCTLQYIRRTDDSWNSIMSGFLTGGILAARAGWKQAGKNAVMGGVILSCIEGVSALLMRSYAKTPRDQALEMLEFEKQEQEQKVRASAGEAGAAGPGIGGMFGNYFMGSLTAGDDSSAAGDHVGGATSMSSFFSGTTSSAASTSTTSDIGGGDEFFAAEGASSSATPSSWAVGGEGGLLPEGSMGAAANVGASMPEKSGGSWGSGFRLPRR